MLKTKSNYWFFSRDSNWVVIGTLDEYFYLVGKSEGKEVEEMIDLRKEIESIFKNSIVSRHAGTKYNISVKVSNAEESDDISKIIQFVLDKNIKISLNFTEYFQPKVSKSDFKDGKYNKKSLELFLLNVVKDKIQGINSFDVPLCLKLTGRYELLDLRSALVEKYLNENVQHEFFTMYLSKRFEDYSNPEESDDDDDNEIKVGEKRKTDTRSEFLDDRLLKKRKISHINTVVDSDDGLCVICKAKEKETVINPCGHLISCEECQLKLTKEHKYRHRCIVCRQEITSIDFLKSGKNVVVHPMVYSQNAPVGLGNGGGFGSVMSGPGYNTGGTGGYTPLGPTYSPTSQTYTPTSEVYSPSSIPRFTLNNLDPNSLYPNFKRFIQPFNQFGKPFKSDKKKK